MTDLWPARFVDFLFEKVVCLPLTLTVDRGERWIRLLGLLWFAIWCVPLMVLCGIPLLIGMLANMVAETWTGKYD